MIGNHNYKSVALYIFIRGPLAGAFCVALIHQQVSKIPKYIHTDCLYVMPRKALPAQIERNEKPLSDATKGERDVIEQLPEVWEQNESYSAMADDMSRFGDPDDRWSASMVGRVARTYFEETTEQSQSDDTVATVRVDQIPDNEKEALAFIRGVKATAQ